MDPDTALVLEDIRQMLAKSERLKKKWEKPPPRENPYAFIDPSINKEFIRTQAPKRGGKRKKPPARIPSLASSSTYESKEEAEVRAITLPYIDSALLVTQSFDVVEKFGYAKQNVGKPTDHSSDTILPALMKRYPRYCDGLDPPSMETSHYRVRNDQWVARLIEECYDAASADCCKPVNQQRQRRRFELDLGAMDAFPLVVRRHIKLLYSTMEHESVICIEFMLALDRVLQQMEHVGLHRKLDHALVSSSGRAELFSAFLAEELEVDRLAVYLHTRDYTQQLLGMRFRDLYVTLQLDTSASSSGSPEVEQLEEHSAPKKSRAGKRRKEDNPQPPAPTTTMLLQDHLFLDPVQFDGDLEALEKATREEAELLPGAGKVVPPSVKLPFFLRLATDACMPDAPLLSLDMRTLRTLCQNLTPACPEGVRAYMMRRCLFWTDVLRGFKGSMFKVTQRLKDVAAFANCRGAGLSVDGLQVVPAQVFLWMICTEMGSYADVTEQIVATQTGVSDETTTEQSVAMLNNVYDQDRAREKAMDEALRLEAVQLSQCSAHLLKLEKRRRLVERKWKEYSPDLSLKGLQAKQAEANKGFAVSDITDLTAEILEFEGLRSALEAKIKRLRKNKKHYLDDVEALWEVALKGKRKFQGLQPAKACKQVKPIRGTTNTKWRDVVIEKIVHAMKRNVQMTEVELAAQVAMAETLSAATSRASDESISLRGGDSEAEYDALLLQFEDSLAAESSSALYLEGEDEGEDDTAALIRELEREARELAGVGRHEEDEEGGLVSDMSSLQGTAELVLDMAHFDSQHVDLREEEDGSACSDLLMLRRDERVSPAGKNFLSEKEETEETEEPVFHHPMSRETDSDKDQMEDEDSLVLSELEDQSPGEHQQQDEPDCEAEEVAALGQWDEARRELASRDAGVFVERLLTSALLSSAPTREELGGCGLFDFVSAEAQRGVELKHAQRLRGFFHDWVVFTTLRGESKSQQKEMQQQLARNVFHHLRTIRKEALDRRIAKILNDQNMKYFLFIKDQNKMKAGVTALRHRIELKARLDAQNSAHLNQMQGMCHFKLRRAMGTMLDRVRAHNSERAGVRRGRRQCNAKLFKRRQECLMHWLVCTKHATYAKFIACVKIQLCVRVFLAVKRVQKARQAAKIRANALVECTKIGREKILRKAIRRLRVWQKKYSSLRGRRVWLKTRQCGPVLRVWREVRAARLISRALRAYFGRKRARARRLRLLRGAELAVGLPVIYQLRSLTRAMAHWKAVCGCKIIFRNLARMALLTKVTRRFAHWKNMSLEYTVFLNEQASVIISMARMRLSKKRHCNFPVVRRGVLRLQCVARGRFAQQVVAVLRARQYGSITIQRHVRGHLCRLGLRQKRIDDIHFSAKNNKFERLKYYCENYFNLTFQADGEGNFALHNAAKHAAKRCLKLLIKFHHDPTLTNSEGDTPLHLLIMSTAIHRDAVFEYMLEVGFDEEQFTAGGKSALMLACEFGRSRIAQLCLQHGLDPNHADQQRTTCLQYAIWGNFAPVVRSLLEHQADANLPGYGGMSPLHDVAATGDLEIAELLVKECSMEAEIDINLQDQVYGFSPVMVAARNGFDEIVLLLCSLLCSVELVDHRGWSAAHHCALVNNPSTVNHLREMVADFDVTDYEGNTPMHIAAENGNHLALREFLSLGAMPSPQNLLGNQPAHLAAKNNHVECLNLLVRYDEHIGRVNYDHRTPLGMAKFYMAMEARFFLEEWFTKVAGPDKRNALGDIWWDAELDGEVGQWVAHTDESNHRVFVNTVTGEASLEPPRLAERRVAAVAQRAEAEMRMKVIRNEAENDVNEHVYLEEHALVARDIQRERMFYDAATVINKTARRKIAYGIFRRKSVQARRRRVLANFFRRAQRVLAVRRMFRNMRMWRRVQACWRGYIFRCHFYYWDGTYDVAWYARARRRLARNVWTLYKDYKFRQMRTTLKVAASAPRLLDEWSEILDRLGHPLRVIGVTEEYLYPGTTNIHFYRNMNTGNIVFQRPREIEEKDLRDHRERIMLTEKGFTTAQERLAKQLQAMWRGYKVRTHFLVIVRARNICRTAEQKFLEQPDNDQHLFNYTLYVQVVLNDYDRARPLYIEMLRKMTHRGPDIAQILYAYAIFSFVVHDQEFEECLSLVERGRVAEEKQYNYLRRQRLKGVDMRGYENYKDIPVSQGATFELASIGFFHHTTTQKQTSEVFHNYAACIFLIYRDFDKAFDAYLRAFQLDPFNRRCRLNYDSMMNFVCGGDLERVGAVARQRMQVLGDKDQRRREQEELVRAEAARRHSSAVRIQRWYSHHRGLREYYKLVEKLRRKKRRMGLAK